MELLGRLMRSVGEPATGCWLLLICDSERSALISAVRPDRLLARLSGYEPSAWRPLQISRRHPSIEIMDSVQSRSSLPAGRGLLLLAAPVLSTVAIMLVAAGTAVAVIIRFSGHQPGPLLSI